MNYLNNAKEKFYKICKDKDLLDDQIKIESRILSPEEAIGSPERDDFPILKGKERIMQAQFQDSIGHVFTDMPGNYSNSINNILNRRIKTNFDRAILIVTINAVLRHLNMIKGTIHCRDNDPEECAKDLEIWLLKKYKGKRTIALVGFQPAFIERLADTFTLNVLDLDKNNFGEKYGVPVLNGEQFYKDILKWGDLVLVTGSVFVNNTIEKIVQVRPIKKIIFYGVTVSGIAELLDLKRVCFYSK